MKMRVMIDSLFEYVCWLFISVFSHQTEIATRIAVGRRTKNLTAFLFLSRFTGSGNN
jgi:hypothetical protein